MSTRQKYFFYLCCLVAFAYGCDRANVPLNKLNEKEIKNILNTKLPPGSSLQQVEDFLKKNKLANNLNQYTAITSGSITVDPTIFKRMAFLIEKAKSTIVEEKDCCDKNNKSFKLKISQFDHIICECGGTCLSCDDPKRSD